MICTSMPENVGEVAERLKAPLSKSGILSKTGSWVRIPPSPPKKYHKTVGYRNIPGEMSELAEGARLEIVCAVKSGTEGSNPSLSAIKI
jgi:hypothetical protein